MATNRIRHFERAKHREKALVGYPITSKKDFQIEPGANLEQFSHDASLVRNDVTASASQLRIRRLHRIGKRIRSMYF